MPDENNNGITEAHSKELKTPDGTMILSGPHKGKIKGKTYMSHKEKAAKYTDPKKIKLDSRRNKVMELRRERGMTLYEISEHMRGQGTRYLEEGQKYGLETVVNDLRAGLRSMREDTQKLAKEYLPEELANLEEEQDQVLSIVSDTYKALQNRKPSLENIEEYEKLQRTFDRALERLDRIRSRRAKYLPMETAKKVNIRSQNVYGSIDEYLALKRQAEEEGQEISDEGMIVEGDFVESDPD